jgi:hypothetical protein
MNFQFSIFPPKADPPRADNFQKKTIKFLVFSLLFLYFAGCNTTQASGLVKAPNNLGLVYYASMEEGKGATVTDFSGRGNIGTMTNMDPSADWVTGKIGKALDFDGTNDYVDMGTAARVIPASTAFSLSWWDQVGSSPSSFEGLFAFATGSKHLLVYRDGTDLYVTPHDGTNAVKFSSVPSLSIPNVWHHWVIVGAAGGESHTAGDYTLYIDGASQAAAGTSGTGSSASQINYIGHDGFDATWKGLIDEVRIYNRALSSTEVAALYAKTSQAVIKNSSRGLVAHWTFEEGTGTATADKTGNGNTGTLGAVTFVNGKYGKAINSTGVNNAVVITSSTSISPSTFTYSWWFKHVSGGGGGAYSRIFSRTSYALDIAIDASTGAMKIYPGWSNFDYILPFDTWTYLALSYDGTNVRLYADGVLQSTLAKSITLAGDQYIMSTWGGSEAAKGVVDDVRIYNRALSAQEVSNLYNSSGEALGILNRAHRDTLTSGLVGYWSFDGPTMTTATSSDSSGQGNHGTLTNGPTKVIGVLGQALRFDGTDDRIVASSPTGLGYGTGDFSWFAWIKPERINDSYEMIWAQGSGGIPYLAINNSSLHFYLSGIYETTASYITANIWQHVGVMRSGGVMTLYKDGVAYGSTSTQSGSISSPDFGYVSSYGSGGAHAFKGNIDEVRVYNRALSASEVLQLYAQGK